MPLSRNPGRQQPCNSRHPANNRQGSLRERKGDVVIYLPALLHVRSALHSPYLTLDIALPKPLLDLQEPIMPFRTI